METTVAPSVGVEDDGDQHQHRTDDLDYWDVLRESQISGFEASIEAALEDVQADGCRRETRAFLRGLRNFTLWATQSEWPRSPLAEPRTRLLGREDRWQGEVSRNLLEGVQFLTFSLPGPKCYYL
jgi:hypothetical protein